MPFTPSHAVIALPFVRTPLIPSAIAIGSMTPDLPLFLSRIGLRYSFTHAFANIALTTLIAFALFLMWRILLRPAACELTPGWVRDRLPAHWRMPLGEASKEAIGVGGPRHHLPILLISLALGVLTHIVWDAFTHADRWGLELWPALAAQWGPVPGYKWMQHGSSVLGVTIIAVWALAWLFRRAATPAGERLLPGAIVVFWAAALPIILGAALLIGYHRLGPFTTAFTPQHLAYAVLPQASALWGALTGVLCLVIAALRARADAQPRGTAGPKAPLIGS